MISTYRDVSDFARNTAGTRILQQLNGACIETAVDRGLTLTARSHGRARDTMRGLGHRPYSENNFATA